GEPGEPAGEAGSEGVGQQRDPSFPTVRVAPAGDEGDDAGEGVAVLGAEAAGDDVQLLDGGGRQLDGRTLGGGLELVLHGDAVHHVDFLADPPAAEMAVRDAGREFDRVRDAVDGEVAELAAYEHLVGDRDVRLDQPNAVHIHGHALQFEGGGLELDLQLGGPSCADLDPFDGDGPIPEQLDVEGALAHGHGGEDE